MPPTPSQTESWRRMMVLLGAASGGACANPLRHRVWLPVI